MSAATPLPKRAPGSLAERFWSIAKSTSQAGDDTTNPDPRAVVRHVLRILDALSAGEVGDGVSQSTVSFLQLLRQQEQAGDLSYASPEQARGESLDERSLVFSVGVLLFEELTGRHPFGAIASGRRFARIQKCELGSGVQYFPQVPAQLRNVLMKAMGPFPEERYRSLKELRGQLERFVDGRPDETPGRNPRRPLKGLAPTPADLAFAEPEEAIPTMLHRRPDPPRAMPSVATTPLKVGSVRAVSVLQPPAEKSSTEKVPSLTASPRWFPVAERLAYVACGALVSLVVAWFALRPRAPVAATATTPAAAAAAPATTPLAAARALDPPALATEPAPTVFDPDLGGRRAAKAARSCFAPERAAKTVSFGIGLLFDKDDGLSRKTYLSPDEPLSPEERHCVSKALLGLSAGAAPPHNTIVEYRFRLHPDGADDVRAAVQK